MIEGSVEYKLGEALAMLRSYEARFDKADESRAKLYSRMDDMGQREARIEGDLKALNDRVGSIEAKVDKHQKFTDDIERIQDQAIGAGTLGRWLIKIGLGVLTVGGWIIGAYTYLTGKPPP